MFTFELKIYDDEGAKCTFYSTLKEGSTLTETDKFFEKYENDQTYTEALDELVSLLYHVIADKYGGIAEIFNRYENQTVGLPPHGNVKLKEIVLNFKAFPLRLYALVVTEEIVILFNGGVKDGPTNQTSSLHMVWVEACQQAKKIEEAIRDGSIIVDTENRKLLNYNNLEEIIL